MLPDRENADLVLETSCSIQQIAKLLKGNQSNRELKNFYSYLRAHCLLVSDHVTRITLAMAVGQGLIFRILDLFESLIIPTLATQMNEADRFPLQRRLNECWHSLQTQNDKERLIFADNSLNIDKITKREFRLRFEEEFYAWEEEVSAQYPEDRSQWPSHDDPQPKTRNEPPYAVWRAAHSVFKALSQCTQCDCHQTHDLDARLCLSTYRSPDSGQTNDFDLFLSLPQALQEARVRAVRARTVCIVVGNEIEPPAKRLKLDQKPMVVKRLCDSILKMQKHTSQRLELKVEKGQLFKLRSERSCSRFDRKKPPISLRQLINQTSRPLTEKTKRILAVLLSYAVLHLHGTPWIQATWDSSKIFFFQTSSCKVPLRPFIQGDLCGQESSFVMDRDLELLNQDIPGESGSDVEGASSNDPDDDDIDPDDFDHPFQTGVSLAVLLMELFFAIPFDILARNHGFELSENMDSAKSSLDIAAIFNVCKHDIPQTSAFYDAIDKCLDPRTWQNDLGETLNDEMLRTVIYQSVVRPFEDDLCDAFTFITIEQLEKIAEEMDVNDWGGTIPNSQLDGPPRKQDSRPLADHHQSQPWDRFPQPKTVVFTTLARHSPPSHRNGFRIAIICALTLEYDAVSLLFDEYWDNDGERYGRAPGDNNAYVTGRMGNHDVVLALLPSIGKTAAAGAAASFCASYAGLKLAVLVGVCAAVPYIGASEVLLGDVVISKTLVQYDFGRHYPNKFLPKNTVEESLGRPSKDIRSLIASFETELGGERLRRRAAIHLEDLQSKAVQQGRRYQYRSPGNAEDKLFPATYNHKHRGQQLCESCHGDYESFCSKAAKASCAELACDENQLVNRKRLDANKNMDSSKAQFPEVFIGRMASGDIVMKSGEHRDKIAMQHDVIAFEMEGAGTWDEIPCVVVKGVSDYADSHKNKAWQPFAAATAAATTKAMLERYPLSEHGQENRRNEFFAATVGN